MVTAGCEELVKMRAGRVSHQFLTRSSRVAATVRAMPRLTTLTTATATLTMLVGLSACSSPDPGSDAGRPETDSPSSTSTSGSAEADPEGAPALSPLDDYIGVGAGVSLTMTADDPELLEYEEAIARCMAKEGFEYVPYVAPYDATFTPDGTVMLEESKPSFPDLPPAEFAARFGYGISTKPPADRKEDIDPNEAIVARMSVAERVAYQQALRGKGNQLDAQGYPSGAGLSSSESSCTGKADGDAPTTDEVVSSQKKVDQVRKSYASLLKRVRGLKDDERADPRMTAATAAWSRCLASAGHPGFDELNDPHIQARADAVRLLGPGLLGADDADPTRLAALRKAEIDLAVADEQCLGDWRTTLAAVEEELEQQFVRDNLEELEKFRSAMSAAVARAK